MINHELYVIYGVSYPVIYLSVLVLLLQVQVRVVVVVMVMAMVMVQINRIRFLFLIGYGRKTHERLCLPFSKRDSQVPLVSFMISNLVMKLFPFSIDHSGSKPLNCFRVIRWSFRSNVPVWTIVCFGHKQLADILATVLFISSRIKIKN